MVSEKVIAEFVQLIDHRDSKKDFKESINKLSGFSKWEQNELLEKILFKAENGLAFFLKAKGKTSVYEFGIEMGNLLLASEENTKKELKKHKKAAGELVAKKSDTAA